MAGPIAFYSPDPIQSTQLIPGGNTPASGAQLFVYQVGTSTKQNSYTDPSASTARTNPIVLDSGGNIPGNGEVWIVSSAKFVLAPSNDTDPPSSPYWTRDNVPGINNITAAQVQALSGQNEWIVGTTPTFVGVTAFSVVGDQTTTYTVGRRVKATVTGGDRFGYITSSAFGGINTAIGVTLDASTLNGGLSAIQYGMLSTPNGSLPWTQVTGVGLSIPAIYAASATTDSFIVGSTSPAIFGLVVKRKTADESVGGTTTVQNDDHLFFPVTANSEWIVDYFIDANDNAASTPTGIKVAVNVPVGSTSNVQAISVMGPVATATTQIASYSLHTASTNGVISFTSSTFFAGGSDIALSVHAWIVAAAAGNIQLQWSPQSASASSLKFYKGSHLTAYRVT